MSDHRLIPLDESVPFVRSVKAIMDGEESYDQAIQLFIEEEEKHHVRIIYDGVTGSLALGLVSVDSAFRPSMREVLDINADTDRLWALYRHETSEEWHEAEQSFLLPFISSTWLLVGGTDFANDHLIEYRPLSLDRPSILNSWTQRAWGGTLGNWAAQTSWANEYRDLWDKGELTYATFCFYLWTIIEDYERWIATVLRIMRMKCEQQLARNE
jgi:hypothetical protein